MIEPLLEVRDLTKHFAIMKGTIVSRQVGAVQAVDGISFSIGEGETFGLVGESGCGKTTTAKLILLLEKATSGTVKFSGKNIQDLSGREVRWYRNMTQAVFQDPFSSLNPRMRVRDIISEPLRGLKNRSSREMKKRVEEVLDIVGLPTRAKAMFPHEFSGGQRQRLAIARALAPEPKFLVLDEPVSALDVSIRAQIINLLKQIQDNLKLTYLITQHPTHHISRAVSAWPVHIHQNRDGFRGNP